VLVIIEGNFAGVYYISTLDAHIRSPAQHPIEIYICPLHSLKLKSTLSHSLNIVWKKFHTMLRLWERVDFNFREWSGQT